VLAHHVVLALPGPEVRHRDAVVRGERADLRVKRLGLLLQRRRGCHRHPQVLPDEPHDAQVALQLRHVQVAVDAVDALQLEHHMAGQDISSGTG
jgi:hypothetical protein